MPNHQTESTTRQRRTFRHEQPPIACPAARLFGWIHADAAPALVQFGVTTQPPYEVTTQPNIEPHHTHAYECPECRLRITCRRPTTATPTG